MSVRKLRIMMLRLSSLPVIVVALFVRPRWGLESSIAFWMEFAGYVFLLGGLAVRMWSIFYIGGRKSGELVTEGPYSLCRNPLYIGSLLIGVGVGLCFENLLMLACVLFIVIPIHMLVVNREERHLAELFPQQFPTYKRQVPRFWPRFRNYRTQKKIMVSVHSIRRVMIDTLGVLLIPEIEDLLELMHEHAILPVLWHFP